MCSEICTKMPFSQKKGFKQNLSHLTRSFLRKSMLEMKFSITFATGKNGTFTFTQTRL